MKDGYVMQERFLHEEMKKMVEKKSWFSSSKEMLDSRALYLPYWSIEVILKLKSPFKKKTTIQRAPMIVNAMTGSTQMVKGKVEYSKQKIDGIFLPANISEKRAQKQAKTQALCLTKKIINPPEHYAESGKLVYYPLSLVRINNKGKEELNIFDHYQGGFAKNLLWYLQKSDIELSPLQ